MEKIYFLQKTISRDGSYCEHRITNAFHSTAEIETFLLRDRTKEKVADLLLDLDECNAISISDDEIIYSVG